MIIELTETEFKSTFGDKMIDVTETAEASLDIWPYVELLNKMGVVEDIVYQDELIEYVYRNDTLSFDHVLLSTSLANHYLVIVVDLPRTEVKGYYKLNLNDLYGLS